MLNRKFFKLRPDDIEDIISMRKQGKSCQEIGEYLGVTKDAVRYHCKRLGLPTIGVGCGWHYRWSPEEDDKLFALYKKGLRLSVIAEKVGRTEKGIISRLNKLKHNFNILN